MPLTFGERLRELRKAKDLTQRELADKVKVDFTYLSKLENDQPGYQPSEKVIRDLARVLGADANELILLGQKIPSDIEKKMMNNPKAQQFLRSAGDLAEQDWDKIIEIVKERIKKKR
jgi:transcriptional regulator with XRE-family HTH domain